MQQGYQYPVQQGHMVPQGQTGPAYNRVGQGPQMVGPGGVDPNLKGPISQMPPYIRSDFIQKVYSILSVQLLFTAGLALYMNTTLTPQWLMLNMRLYYACLAVSMGTMIGVTCCCQEAARTFPTNYLFLGVVTVCMAAMVGMISVMYTTESVIIAMFTTALIFMCLTAYACITKSDWTGIGPYLSAALCGMMAFSVVLYIVSRLGGQIPTQLHLLYAGFGVLLFSFYIVYDTQLVVGGSHAHQFSVDDYAFAALNLYLDVINLFLYILQLLGDRR